MCVSIEQLDQYATPMEIHLLLLCLLINYMSENLNITLLPWFLCVASRCGYKTVLKGYQGYSRDYFYNALVIEFKDTQAIFLLLFIYLFYQAGSRFRNTVCCLRETLAETAQQLV